jgi:hypothetical protein
MHRRPASPHRLTVHACMHARAQVEFVVSMPHFYLTQPQGLRWGSRQALPLHPLQRTAHLSHPPLPSPLYSIPVTAWYDSTLQRSKIASFGGMDTVMFITEGDEVR